MNAGKGEGDPDASLAEMNAWAQKYGSTMEMKTAKFFLDGVPDYPAQTAYVIEPYKTLDAEGSLADSDNHGKQYMSDDVAKLAATRLLAGGWTLHFHALGDAASRQALGAIEAVRTANPDKADVRNTVVHVQLLDTADVERFPKLGALASFQEQWSQRASRGPRGSSPMKLWDFQYPTKSIWDAGLEAGTISVAGGSDWPVDPLEPFVQIQLTVTRTNPDPGDRKNYMQALGPDQALTIEQALRMHTYNSAWGWGMEDRLGTLEVGKLADVIVLDRNLLTVDPTEISATQVVATLLEGQVMHGELAKAGA